VWLTNICNAALSKNRFKPSNQHYQRGSIET
jgi:hypothetical protein